MSDFDKIRLGEKKTLKAILLVQKSAQTAKIAEKHSLFRVYILKGFGKTRENFRGKIVRPKTGNNLEAKLPVLPLIWH